VATVFFERARSLRALTLLLFVLAVIVGPGCGMSARSMPPEAHGTAPFFTSKVRVVPGLAEPLVTTKPTTEDEDLALAQATEGRDGAEGPLLAFLAAHPDSGWNAAIHTDLGLAYYRGGFFSKAIASYEAAWKEGREAADFRARALVDRALGELAKMHARVGHQAELSALIAEVGDRPIEGGAAELLTGAKEGSWTMSHNPGISYLCGPKALENVLHVLGAAPEAIATVESARSSEHGFTLAELGALAGRAGLAHRLVHRAPGDPIPVPSVINWRVSHYAAIVGKTERGTYQIKDPTFGGDLEISETAIDEEGSGFYLVPLRAGPEGNDARVAWRDATPDEARAAFGMGFPGSYLLGAVTPADLLSDLFKGADSLWNSAASLIPTFSGCNGMCVPNATAMEVSLNVRDTPVGYAPPVGPPAFVRLTYNQREAVEPYGPPSNPVSFNVGPQWTLNVLSYVLDNPLSPGATVSRYVPGGGAVSAYTDYSATTGAFDPEKQTGAVLSRTPATGMATSYTLTGTDGSQLVYATNDGSTGASTYRRLFLTSIKDPQGNALTLTYDTSVTNPDAGVDGGPPSTGSATFLPRLTTITDPNGVAAVTFTYGLDATPLLVTKITDGFGRFAQIAYDAEGRLSSITDVLGITSTVAYDDGNTPPRPTFVKQLTTPYGITSFNYGETNSGSAVVSRWLETTDPLGHTERMEFMESAPGIPSSDETGANLALPAGMPLAPAGAVPYLIYRNTFFWNKHIYAQYGTGVGKDYTKAELVHWLHTNNGQYVAPTLESIRHPLEHRVWYEYTPSQTNSIDEGPPYSYLGAPTTTARVLDDGSTQLTSTTRNRLGKPLVVTDAVGRQTQFSYAANGIDLTTVQHPKSPTDVETLASYTYNAQHERTSYTDAAGQTTQFAYNGAGQLQSVTDALGNLQTVVYDAQSHVSKLLDANNLPLVTLTYDDANRVATRSDAVGYKVSYQYDAFDRTTKVTYPDGTSEQYAYTNLDLTSKTDRLGQTTSYGYDADRRLTSVTDPLGHVTQYAYYEDGTLESVTDANKNITSWDVDLERRPTAKHYANGTSETYTYEATTSRLKSKTDANGQVANFAYGADNTLAKVSYTTAAGLPLPTPTVSFQYDADFPRLTGMTDGTGTTTYAYYPIAPTPGAGRLQFVASPVAGAAGGAIDVVSYAYDALGRVTGRSVNGATQSVSFDALGRPSAVSNALDTFTYGYADETPRVTSLVSTHGPKATLAYYGVISDPGQNELVQQLTYATQSGGPPLSKFGYAYDANGNVQTFTETRLGSPTAGTGGSDDGGGATGMVLPRLLQGPRGIGVASSWTRAREGVTALLALTVGALLAILAWTRSSRGRLASTLAPIALGLIFVACGNGDDHGGPSPSTDAGSDATGGSAGNAGDVLQTQITAYKYDAASRLVSATLGTNGMAPAANATPQYAYDYDAVSNATSIAANSAPQTPTYTNANEVVGGNYDPNGSPKTLGGGTYTWDAANRLASATVNGVETDFSYDGESRLVRIVEKQGSTTIADKAYTWSGGTRVLEHDNAQPGSLIDKQYFARGFVGADGLKEYYVADRLGSVRQIVDGNGTIQAQYQYDPYGAQTKLGGDVDSDVGFAGYFDVPSTGLDFATYRAYQPSAGRWLNRDPLGEHGGLNLYGYAGQNPVRSRDASGLCLEDLCIGEAALAYELYEAWVGAEVVTTSLSAADVLTWEATGLVDTSAAFGTMAAWASNAANGVAAYALTLANSSPIVAGAILAINKFATEGVDDPAIGDLLEDGEFYEEWPKVAGEAAELGDALYDKYEEWKNEPSSEAGGGATGATCQPSVTDFGDPSMSFPTGS
jgi:RHS repeat-associated protein